MFILKARRLSSKLLKQGYLVERWKSSFKKFYGRYGDLIQKYEVFLSRMFNDILTLDQLQWLPNRSDFLPMSWPWYKTWPSTNFGWFPWIIASGVANQQETLLHPNTWFRPPFGDLRMLQLLRQFLPNLSYLLSTFHLEYRSVLSQMCFVIDK